MRSAAGVQLCSVPIGNNALPWRGGRCWAFCNHHALGGALTPVPMSRPDHDKFGARRGLRHRRATKPDPSAARARCGKRKAHESSCPASACRGTHLRSAVYSQDLRAPEVLVLTVAAKTAWCELAGGPPPQFLLSPRQLRGRAGRLRWAQAGSSSRSACAGRRPARRGLSFVSALYFRQLTYAQASRSLPRIARRARDHAGSRLAALETVITTRDLRALRAADRPANPLCEAAREAALALR